VAFCGDWHANDAYAARVIEFAGQRGVSVVVQVGDFGFLLTDEFLDSIHAAAEKAGVVVLWIDGNHDDHDKIRRMRAFKNFGPIEFRPRVVYLPRTYRWEWSGVRFLALGGAHSIDRPYRTLGESYWLGERITAAQARRAKAGGAADVMITHDCPHGVNIPGLTDPRTMPTSMQYELAASDEHRRLLREVVDVVQPSMLVCGHYHRRCTDVLCLESGAATLVHVMDCDGVSLTENCMIMSVEDLAKGVGAQIRSEA